ncbi:ABC transporter substrate-binding protein [Paenibacillus cisolokensis]|uniref:ABC transporter substrate-binding protein n=1 Tax=Paenibacillus cisolokensis TaxID=1658519 RepID=A0ABQ4N0B8_9BACL|nr:ABC transporter substrate-binding protein [Paenibacillus cisolokensis]GIQ61582.1 ABC transporter substrate-binding protein [Paenibacillus cisolokensis]
MKKRMALTLLALLTIVMAACSSSGGADSPGTDSGESGSGKTAQKPVTLTLLSHYVGQNEVAFKPYIDQWNSENPDIQIKLTPVDFGELLRTIMTKQTAGQAPDLMHIYTLWGGQLAKNNVLAFAPDDVAADIEANYPASAVAASSIDGRVYGYPTEVQAYGLFYNKKLLQEAGYGGPPKTWDELIEMAQHIERDDGSGMPSVQGFGFLRGYAGKVVQPFMALMATAGGTLLTDDMSAAALDTEAAKRTIDLYAKVYGKDGITDIGFPTQQAFGSGKAAMTIEAGWWAGSLKTLMKDGYADIGAAPLPSPDGLTQGSLAYTWAWSVNAKSKHQEEAWKFLKWFNTQKVKNDMTPQGNFLLEGFNVISTRASDMESETIKRKLEEDPVTKVFADALQYARPEQNPAAAAEIQDALFKQIENMWADKATKEEALAAAQKEIQAKLGK